MGGTWGREGENFQKFRIIGPSETLGKHLNDHQSSADATTRSQDHNHQDTQNGAITVMLPPAGRAGGPREITHHLKSVSRTWTWGQWRPLEKRRQAVGS